MLDKSLLDPVSAASLRPQHGREPARFFEPSPLRQETKVIFLAAFGNV